MRVLVTRPEFDARATAEALRARGHIPLLAPLLEVRFRPGAPQALDGIDGILATSANGVRALAERTERRELPLFAVGPQTAAAAREAGFLSVVSADGDAAALAEAVPRWLTSGTLFHAAGDNAQGTLAAALAAKGYAVESEVLYDVVAATALPAPAAEALAAGALDAALFFSLLSARIFAACVQPADLADACTRLIAACISEATAKALSPLVFAALRVAEKPNQEALLACLDGKSPSHGADAA
jgi:uroporphyrinogen-III synthase